MNTVPKKQESHYATTPPHHLLSMPPNYQVYDRSQTTIYCHYVNLNRKTLIINQYGTIEKGKRLFPKIYVKIFQHNASEAAKRISKYPTSPLIKELP